MTMRHPDIETRKKEVANDIFIPQVINMINGGHTVTIGLRGYSMRPFLEDRRDKALIAKPSNITVGDVVLAEIGPRKYALHRIICINGDNVTLRGDGNLNVEVCKRDDIHGIAEGFYRKGRNRLDSVKGWKWRLYSFVWTRCFPIRRCLLFAYRAYLRINKIKTNTKNE